MTRVRWRGPFYGGGPLVFMMLGRLAAAILWKMTGRITETDVDRWLMWVFRLPGWLRLARLANVPKPRGPRGMAGERGNVVGEPSAEHPSRPIPVGGSSPGSWTELLRKEARLHVVPWLVAGMMVGSWCVYLLIQWIRTRIPIPAGRSILESWAYCSPSWAC